MALGRVEIEAPRARYQQVAELLRGAIERGDYPPGAQLPSQPELARAYGLNQTTINRAIAVLRHEGLVNVERGRGAYVLVQPTVTRLRRVPAGARRTSSFAEEMRKLGLEPRTELVDVSVMEPPADVAELLHLDVGGRVVRRHRRMYASEQPVQLATSFIPLEIAGDEKIAVPDTGPTGIYERLAERGHQPVRFVEEIQVRRPAEDEAAFLRVGDGPTVLEVTRTAVDAQGTAVEVAVNALAATRWRLTYEWAAEGS